MKNRRASVWVIENLNDEGFQCGRAYTTKALALKDAAECRAEGIYVQAIREEDAETTTYEVEA